MPNELAARLFVWSIIFTACSLLLACQSSPEPIPFPTGETQFAEPSVQALRFTEPQQLNVEDIRRPDITLPEPKRLNLDAFDSKPFYPDGMIPFSTASSINQFDLEGLADTTISFEDLPIQNFLTQTAFLQPPSLVKAGLPPFIRNASLSIFEFTEEQGLPDALVSTCFQDRNGFIWIATSRGLCRLNGEYLEVYSFVDKVFTGGNTIISRMIEDSQGRIWMRTNGNYLYIVDVEQGLVTTISVPFGIFNPDLNYDMHMDNGGKIWLGTAAFGTYVINPFDFSIRALPLLSAIDQGNAIKFESDQHDNIWIGSNQGISIVNKSTGRVRYLNATNGLPSDRVTGLYSDAFNRMWISTRAGGISIIDLESGSIQLVGPKQGIETPFEHFEIDNEGLVWASSNAGIYTIDLAKNRYRRIGEEDGLSDNTIISLSKDNAGQLWVGTMLNLNILPTEGLMPQYLTTDNGLSGNDVWSYDTDDWGRLWIGSRGGLDIYDPKTKRIVNLDDRFLLPKSRNVSYYTKQSPDQKRIIAAAGSGFQILDKEAKKFTNLTSEHGLENTFAPGFIIDSKHRIWTGGFAGTGIELINMQDQSHFRIQNRHGLIGDIIWEFMEDLEGNIWVATDSAVSIIDPEKWTIKHIMLDNKRAKLNSGALLLDSQGKMWISDRQALWIADPDAGTMTRFGTENGLIAPDTYTLYQHELAVYAGTGNGLTIFTPKNRQLVDSDEFPWNFHSYTQKQGLQFTDFNAGAAIVFEKKAWWGIEPSALSITNIPERSIATTNTVICGLVVGDATQTFTDPARLYENLSGIDSIWSESKDSLYTITEPPMGRSTMQAGLAWDATEGPFNLPVNLKIPFEQNFLQFQYTASVFQNRDQVQYRHILEGFDEAWSQTSSAAISKAYRNLPAGRYRFKVVSKSSQAAWSEPATFSFQILPPWYNTWYAYLLYLASFSLVVGIIVKYRSRQLERQNIALERKIADRTAQLHESIEDLKETQSQLIQSEKMASLGEITAGIAHEIQNPLNFVNNFSDINKELLEELVVAIKNKDTTEAELIAKDLIDNESKITHHGKRAEGIVRSMLQHSRTGAAKKELTDINLLADEYLRLAYHGFRAKDKRFNAELKTSFEENLPHIKVVAQDIGRVLLNLLNNAMHAVSAKASAESNTGYTPTVSVTTRKSKSLIEIVITDNGPGIPASIKDKIFQPFFTTKPTGEGTGLGLSMSYDIITKGHKGELLLKSVSDGGSMFIIQLPIIT